MKYLILIILGLSVSANYPYYKFKPEELKIRKESFYRYIRPQLKNIKSEFYHLSRKLSPQHDEIIKLREFALKLKIEFKKKFDECEKQKLELKYCELDVKQLTSLSYKLDKQILRTRKYILQPNSKNIFKNNYIFFVKHLDEIDILNNQIQRSLELRNIVNGTVYTTYSKPFSELSNPMNRLFTIVNFAFTDFIPKNVSPAFERLLIHFITPIEDKMIYNFESNWLRAHLGNLNLDWNTFHMELEKGQKDFPKSLIKTVKIMHNRWNSILKIVF